MGGQVQLQALSRQMRAWYEAKYILSKRTAAEKQELVELGSQRGQEAKNISSIFNKLENIPCANCTDCCTRAAFDSGFYKHSERQMLIQRGVNIFDYHVKKWENKDKEPEYRCLFLKETGCNIPSEHRSAMCLGYACHSKLGRDLARNGLAEEYDVALSSLMKTTQKMAVQRRVPFDADYTNNN